MGRRRQPLKGGGAILNPENVAGPSVGRSQAPSIFSRKSSYNPAAVGLSLTNSQIGSVLPNWADALDNFSTGKLPSSYGGGGLDPANVQSPLSEPSSPIAALLLLIKVNIL